VLEHQRLTLVAMDATVRSMEVWIVGINGFGRRRDKVTDDATGRSGSIPLA
jgi:hypothetical protein